MAALGLATLHVVGGHVRRLRVIPRSWMLSAGSGISVAYVFVHLLPELADIQRQLEETLVQGWLAYLEIHAWIVALFGLGVFYGLELAARRSRATRAMSGRPPRETSASTSAGVGWLRLGTYAIYNGIIGYLLTQRASVASLVFFAVAMGVHFLVNDYGLRQHHGRLYHAVGRWLLAGGVMAGWAIGGVTDLAPAVLGLLVAFLAGGVVMNVLKEELPEDRASRWSPFALAAVLYTALLLAT
ncbi:hypothetical protein [Egicoccus sp. AB-alg2]|uniref:hypothetical protein n=1 Tax=Egicoccus sp. AB-alg2 TaxID=3242693 RepID=UPI00359D1EE3